jgi:hypothetical protein
MTIQYPEDFLRGIPNNCTIWGEAVDHTAFIQDFQPGADGWHGVSVNWEFDRGALEELMNRPRNGGLQFEAGALRIPTGELDFIIRKWDLGKQLEYEHKEENGNRYHGNVRFHVSMNKALRRTVCAALARAACLIKRELSCADGPSIGGV